jgi:mono/diheme cytochrome c family protein/glucose/arabinose dehydrogenase
MSMSQWSVIVGLVAVLMLGVVPRSEQQPVQPAPAQPPSGRGEFDEVAAGADFLPRPPVVRLTPERQVRLFLLPTGYKIEPVLADPLIEDPVGVTFDGNGRLYVLEMRSYMQDVNGSDSRAPISRISRHEDTDGDGTYDRHTVFVDRMVLPRIAFPLQDGVILALETDNPDMFKYIDTDGDGVADKKELFYAGAGRVTNMEWQPGGMAWALDNWLYTTYNPFRLRLAPNGQVIREETDPNGGQWWVAQDNYGKLWFVDGGGEMGPVNFQVPIIYGAINVTDNFEPDFRVPWPAPGGIGDMQGGMRRVRMPDGTLNHFTSASGVEIYRGHRLPEDMRGDLFFTEPVGRIVRQAKIVVTDGVTQLRNAYPKSEFIRSTDPLFRPVAVSNAPDGSLYVIDMYTGIIQDAQFIGTYLRRKVEQYELDKQHNWGRIWRVTHEGAEPDRRQPRMYAETAAQLVQHLDHPNGWWRDTAQKLIVLRQDKTVVPALRAKARTSNNQLARIHALWTLEGLESLDAALVRELMESPDPQIRIQAIRVSESLYKSRGERSFAADYRALTKDPDHSVAIQAMLTANLLKVDGYTNLIESTIAASTVRGVREIGTQLLKPQSSQGQSPSLADKSVSNLNPSAGDRRVLARGEAIYRELCFACHGTDGKGAPMAGAPSGTLMAPPLAGASRVVGHRDYPIKILLNGLSGELDGVEYPGGIMAPMGTNSDEWVADISSYIRKSFGNAASFVSPAHVAEVRKATASRRGPWTLAELEASTPTLLTNHAAWKATASHNSERAASAVDGSAATQWDSGASQEQGMWFQIELPQTVNLAELHVDASRSGEFGTPATDPMRAYSVQVSTDGTTWSAPVAEGKGQSPTTVIAITPVAARFVRITQTAPGPNANPWAIQGLRIYVVGR